MAAAEKLHDLLNAVSITVAPGGTISNSQGYLWVPDNSNVSWNNTGASQFDIVFTIGGLAPIHLGGRGSSAPIANSEFAVNYVVQQNGITVSGPYCIQWGNGALQVSVTANGGAFTVAVPATLAGQDTGNLQFTSDADYLVGWSKNVWSPEPPEIYPTPVGGQNPNPVQRALAGAASPVICTFGPGNVPQNGTVHIGS
jgi:hypothetical protein